MNHGTKIFLIMLSLSSSWLLQGGGIRKSNQFNSSRSYNVPINQQVSSNSSSSSSSFQNIINVNENMNENTSLAPLNPNDHQVSSNSSSASSATNAFLMRSLSLLRNVSLVNKRPHPDSGSSSSSSQSSMTRNNENTNENNGCSICLEAMHDGELCDTSCAHRFHAKCIIEWLEKNNYCPLCRKKIITV